MTWQELYQGLMAGWQNMTWLEGAAVVFAIISVLCARANNIWVYPMGIAGILVSVYIFAGEAYKLYPDAALNVYYLVMSIYGWYYWVRKPDASGEGKRISRQTHTPVTWCSNKELLTAGGIFLVLWILLYGWLSIYKINNVPLMDSFSSAMACAGMWLLAKRKIENWIALLIADVVDVGMFFVKKLILFCGLNLFYVVICILGFIAWKEFHKKQGSIQAVSS